MSELKYWVWLSMRHGVRPRTRLELLEHFSGVRELYFAAEADYAATGVQMRSGEARELLRKDLDGAERALSICEKRDIHIITLRDAAYPQRLRQIYDPPTVLYVRGRLPILDDRAAVAVVGTRRATGYGLRMAEKLGREITACGGIVLSGLTDGIDAAAARGVVRSGGVCIGVSGVAIDAPFGGVLAERVIERGAVVSEFAPGSRPFRQGFRMRNRITSGLSVATVVVEAPERSGALLFAGEAEAQSKEVFCVPGNADSFSSRGSNELLKDGARPATCAWDVLADFASLYPGLRPCAVSDDTDRPSAPEPPPARRQKEIDKENNVAYIDLEQALTGLTARQLQIVSVWDVRQMHIDELAEKSGLPFGELMPELAALQLAGVVTQDDSMCYTLNIQAKV